MLSITSILFAALRFSSKSKCLLWLAISAAADAFAIDEVFEFHERTKYIVGDDDYIKMVFWFIAGVCSCILYFVEHLTQIYNDYLLEFRVVGQP